MYDNKIAIVIKDDLQSWQKLNVTAFLASSVAIKFPETHGKSLVSASGSTYKADTDNQIKRAFTRAKDRELNIGIYTKAQFGTRNEEQNVTEIGSRTDDELDLVGVIVYGPNKKVDKALNGLRFHS